MEIQQINELLSTFSPQVLDRCLAPGTQHRNRETYGFALYLLSLLYNGNYVTLFLLSILA